MLLPLGVLFRGWGSKERHSLAFSLNRSVYHPEFRARYLASTPVWAESPLPKERKAMRERLRPQR